MSAGTPIGFTITVSNFGDADAADVILTDPLPSGTGVDWSIAGPTGTPTCGITGAPPTETLTCTTNPLAQGANFTVHVSSNTTAASCKAYDNTASVSGSGFGPLTANASVTGQCPDISIVKTPNVQTKNAGEAIEFEIVVANSAVAGTGTATAVQLNDPLPAGTGVDWSVSAGYPTGHGGLTPPPPTCTVGGTPPNETLTCTAVDLAAGQGYTVRVRSNTAFASCATYENTATVSGTNFPNDDDVGHITVQCRAGDREDA